MNQFTGCRCSYLAYDTLFGIDEDLQVKPQMVNHLIPSADGMKYTFTLRDWLRWHDGRPVLAEDCVESVKMEQEQSLRPAAHGAYGQACRLGRQDLRARTLRTFRLRPRGVGKPACPLHDAGADRVHSCGGADQGGGRQRAVKFAHDEWQPGEQVVYLRNPDYVPRDETPSGSTGGKKALSIR